jgi:NitT/TauT family transport system substrate-binding protein
MTGRLAVLICVAAACVPGHALAQDTTLRVGLARSTSNAAELMAIERGYFKEYGIKLEIEDLDSSANAIALLAQNRFQIVAGGISAGYFNALEKELPITIVTDRVSTPIGTI